MPYRQEDKLGPKLSDHRPSAGSWIGAGIFSLVAAAAGGWYVLNAERGSMQTLVGVFMMGGFGFYSIVEWKRLTRIHVALHERGLFYVSAATTPLSIAWDEVAALEARYVPGMRKRGVTDEGNRVSLVITTTGGARIDLPKELPGFFPLCATVEQRTGKPITRTLVQNLMNR
jgi:hypothetical protein